ncbi:hypothetical protein A2774_01155 [Candidatus Roizmanbacteria bacterium RIFCSPHIGHO2_01_FULL_39_12c]|uniref:DUF4258 domain-containing protein n=1 Tax=Candidatus Roizmanbacteria bacterium RIFCSPHIGHO2_01_FULL_39_12c TaxID=1802031 RepID=A0A1F7G862_9BACT|nr:MAG: hypothetical protein A2774_01155 [Candidatus Roizmanbacteria bacterium RIFCSPHIGHO2_01_FULL_39_12c]OGK46437.1 MAG: hypothetical protein A2963_01560 [Candidatus Roizmanbacteria bacterium RIFCSPLOWO2_01_FULL_40_13]
MIKVRGLIWDDWNKKHLANHSVTPEEVEEVCHSKFRAVTSYRGRIQLMGKTKKGRGLIIILSPEGRDLKPYGNDIYYVITAFEEVQEL